MASYSGPIVVAPKASTGNNTHASVPMPPEADHAAFQFVVEAVGATPTVTWKIQGSLDDPSITDANSAWFDIAYNTTADDTLSVAARVVTAVGKYVNFKRRNTAHFFRKVRLVTTANTNVTYRCELITLDRA